MITYIILRSEALFYMHRMFAMRREYRETTTLIDETNHLVKERWGKE